MCILWQHFEVLAFVQFKVLSGFWRLRPIQLGTAATGLHSSAPKPERFLLCLAQPPSLTFLKHWRSRSIVRNSESFSKKVNNSCHLVEGSVLELRWDVHSRWARISCVCSCCLLPIHLLQHPKLLGDVPGAVGHMQIHCTTQNCSLTYTHRASSQTSASARNLG